MITRFRVEGEGGSQEEVIEELSKAATRIIRVLDQINVKVFGTEWECTQDIVLKSENGYRGRMVMKFHNQEDEDETEG